ncbi:MAG TPA: NIPSNAP family protein [Chryseosolibacter sp.]
MERREFIQKSVLATSAITAAAVSPAFAQQAQDKEVYEWRVYEMTRTQGGFENFMSKAFIPALNRLGVKKVGAFSEMSKAEPVKFYVLIPYSSFADYLKVNNALKSDKAFLEAATDYNKIPVEQAVYSRFHSSLMIAFDGLPKMIAPANEKRMFELRTYEGYSEDAVRRKIKMFNDEEFVIFNRVKLNPVFFGEVIAGPNMPALTYMLTFKNMEERDQNWKAFGGDPDWQRILKDPQYANTVSKIYKIFLEPLSYSQI